MTPSDLLSLISAQIDSANSALAQNVRELLDSGTPTDTLEVELQEREAIDTACRYFAKHRRLPQISKTQARLFYTRLAFAKRFLKTLLESPLSPSQELDVDDSKAIEFLLISYWDRGGRARWVTADQSFEDFGFHA